MKKKDRELIKKVMDKIAGIPCDICRKPMQPKDKKKELAKLKKERNRVDKEYVDYAIEPHEIKKGMSWSVFDRTSAIAMRDMVICDECWNKMLHDEETKELKKFFWFAVCD